MSRSPTTTISALLITVAVTAVYGSGLSIPFFFDDVESIVLNDGIRRLWPLGDALTGPDQTTIAGRPLVALSLALNYALGGLDVRGYHVFNVACHALSAIALLALLRRALRRAGYGDGASRGMALVAALLWALHPLQTEAVAYVVQRTELMMGLAYLATLWAAARGLDSDRPRRWFVLSALCCAAGMACKEVMVSAPIAVLLYDRAFVAGTFRGALRRSPGLYAGLGASWMLLVALVAGGHRTDSVGYDHGVSAAESLMTQAQVVPHYLRLALWPDPLVVHYDWPVVRDLGDAASGGALVLALLAVAIWALRRHPAVGFAAATFFMILAPTSSALPIVTETAAERRMYLPLAVLVALATVGTHRLLRKLGESRSRRAVVPSAVAAIALAYAVTGARRLDDYETVLTIWTDTVAKRPDNYQAHFELGLELQRLGRDDDALASFRRSYELEPSYVPTLTSMAVSLLASGRADLAIEHSVEALVYEPRNASLHHNLGLALAHTGRFDQARQELAEALRLRPDYADAHSNLAVLLLAADGDRDRATWHVRQALRLEPGHAKARDLLDQLSAPTSAPN